MTGLLLGTAVGDALGLPAEGLSRARLQRRWHGEWRMRLAPGRGLVSDDTDHAFLVGQSLLVAADNATDFRNALAKRLRWWFLSLPAGVGLATARACLKLCLGISPERSGVCSAGNGPAMRSAIIGACFFDDEPRRREWVGISTRITHTDARSETAALAVAEAAAWVTGGHNPSRQFLKRLPTCGGEPEWLRICEQLNQAFVANASVEELAGSLGLANGVTGYAFHTVPVALYAWLRHPGDFRGALVSTLDCGGDTDTVGAIVGALTGAQVGEVGIPAEWLQAVCEWPRTLGVLRQLAGRLARAKGQAQASKPVTYFWPGLVPRNLVLLLLVLAHGFRRLLPPY